jgi:hypothetical protein
VAFLYRKYVPSLVWAMLEARLQAAKKGCGMGDGSAGGSSEQRAAGSGSGQRAAGSGQRAAGSG